MSNILIHSCHPLIQLKITIPLRGRCYYYLYFTNKETEAQNNLCPISHSEYTVKPQTQIDNERTQNQFLWYVCVWSLILTLEFLQKQTYAQTHTYNYTYVHMYKHFKFLKSVPKFIYLLLRHYFIDSNVNNISINRSCTNNTKPLI